MNRTDDAAPLPAGVLLAGEVAQALGVGVQTLHYYEREELIPAPPRSASGYRLYTPALVERVAFIRKAQALGLPLAEIRDVLRLAEQGASPCGRVQAALAAKLAEVDRRLGELLAFRDQLADLVAQTPNLCAPGPADASVCAIVEAATPPARSGEEPSGLPAAVRRRSRGGHTARGPGTRRPR